jgi:hypothetical protein
MCSLEDCAEPSPSSCAVAMIVERRMVEVMVGFGDWVLSRDRSRREKMLMGVVLAAESKGFDEGGGRGGE